MIASRPHHRRHAGFTIIEVIVALAITAMIMVSLAAAFTFAIDAYVADQTVIQLNTSTRDALNHILARARMTARIEPLTRKDDFKKNRQDKRVVNGKSIDNGVADLTGLVLSIDTTPADDPAAIPQTTTLTYQYEAATKKLTLAIGAADPVPLAENITAFEARLFPARSDKNKRGGNLDCDIATQVIITITAEGSALGGTKPTAILSGSAVPRAAVWKGSQTAYPIDDMLSDPKNRKKAPK